MGDGGCSAGKDSEKAEQKQAQQRQAPDQGATLE
jgi:hypothetical protein